MNNFVNILLLFFYSSNILSQYFHILLFIIIFFKIYFSFLSIHFIFYRTWILYYLELRERYKIIHPFIILNTISNNLWFNFIELNGTWLNFRLYLKYYIHFFFIFTFIYLDFYCNIMINRKTFISKSNFCLMIYFLFSFIDISIISSKEIFWLNYFHYLN